MTEAPPAAAAHEFTVGSETRRRGLIRINTSERRRSRFDLYRVGALVPLRLTVRPRLLGARQWKEVAP